MANFGCLRQIEHPDLILTKSEKTALKVWQKEHPSMLK